MMFDQSPCDEAAVGELSAAVGFANRFGFLADVESVLGLELHAEGHLERFDAGFQCEILPTALKVIAVEFLHQVEQTSLAGLRKILVVDMPDDFFGIDLRVVDMRTLINSRQETARP
jgi:hypothetical protein